MSAKPVLLYAALTLAITSAASGYEHAGDVSSWRKDSGGIHLKCGAGQVARIDILTECLFRVRFSVDGSFPASKLIEEWRLVKPNKSFRETPFEVREEETHLWLTTSQIRLKLNKAPLRLHVYDRHNRLLTRESDTPGMGAGRGAYLQMEKAAAEHFFGLGEGIGATSPDVGFEEKQILDTPLHGIQLKEGKITLDQTGKKAFLCLGPNWAGFNMTPVVIPFFMNTRGYGIYLNNFRDSIFDLGNSNAAHWSITQGGPPNHVSNTDVLDYYFLYGPSFKQILARYTDLTGRTPLAPKWSLGYFQICGFNQTQDEVLNMAAAFRRNDLPCDMLGLEPGWMKSPYRMDGWPIVTLRRAA